MWPHTEPPWLQRSPMCVFATDAASGGRGWGEDLPRPARSGHGFCKRWCGRIPLAHTLRGWRGLAAHGLSPSWKDPRPLSDPCREWRPGHPGPRQDNSEGPSLTPGSLWGQPRCPWATSTTVPCLSPPSPASASSRPQVRARGFSSVGILRAEPHLSLCFPGAQAAAVGFPHLPAGSVPGKVAAPGNAERMAMDGPALHAALCCLRSTSLHTVSLGFWSFIHSHSHSFGLQRSACSAPGVMM